MVEQGAGVDLALAGDAHDAGQNLPGVGPAPGAVAAADLAGDRFHVERLAADAVDEVRRAEQRRPDLKDAKALKGARYDLLKHPARLKPGEARHLEKLRRANRAWTGLTS